MEYFHLKIHPLEMIKPFWSMSHAGISGAGFCPSSPAPGRPGSTHCRHHPVPDHTLYYRRQTSRKELLCPFALKTKERKKKRKAHALISYKAIRYRPNFCAVSTNMLFFFYQPSSALKTKLFLDISCRGQAKSLDSAVPLAAGTRTRRGPSG